MLEGTRNLSKNQRIAEYFELEEILKDHLGQEDRFWLHTGQYVRKSCPKNAWTTAAWCHVHCPGQLVPYLPPSSEDPYRCHREQSSLLPLHSLEELQLPWDRPSALSWTHPSATPQMSRPLSPSHRSPASRPPVCTSVQDCPVSDVESRPCSFWTSCGRWLLSPLICENLSARPPYPHSSSNTPIHLWMSSSPKQCRTSFEIRSVAMVLFSWFYNFFCLRL